MTSGPLPTFPAGDLHAACVARAAEERGVRVEITRERLRPDALARSWLKLFVCESVYYYRSGVLRLAVGGSGLQGSRNVNHRIVRQTSSKHTMKAILSLLGVPVPRGCLVGPDELAAAHAFLERLGRPVCLKPDGGLRGRYVFPAVADAASLTAAFGKAARRGPVVVEEHLHGEALRMMYVRPNVVGVRIDRPASVVGDGLRTLRGLVAAKNEERLRRSLPGHVPIGLDEEVGRYLAVQGLRLDDVPSALERVFLRGTSNIPTGGDSIDCRPRLHPSYVALVERFCRALPDLVLAAVDLVVEDVECEAQPGNQWVLEVNSAPGLVPFHFPWEGEPQDVSGALVDRLLAGGW